MNRVHAGRDLNIKIVMERKGDIMKACFIVVDFKSKKTNSLFVDGCDCDKQLANMEELALVLGVSVNRIVICYEGNDDKAAPAHVPAGESLSESLQSENKKLKAEKENIFRYLNENASHLKEIPGSFNVYDVVKCITESYIKLKAKAAPATAGEPLLKPLPVSAQKPVRKYKGREGKVKGVGYHKGSGKWRANIRVDGKIKFLGQRDTEQEAIELLRQYHAVKIY